MKKYLFVASCLFCAVILTRFLVRTGFVPFFVSALRSVTIGKKQAPTAQALPATRPLFIYSSRPAAGYADPPIAWWAVQSSGEFQRIAQPTLDVSENRQSNFDALSVSDEVSMRLAYAAATGAEVTELVALNLQGTQAIFTEHDAGRNTAGRGAATVKTIIFDIQSKQERTIYSGQMYGDCSRVVGWNEEKSVLYAVAYQPISSEVYMTHFCTISILDGTRSRVVALPNANKRGFTQLPTLDDRSGRAVFITQSDDHRVYLADFQRGEVQPLPLPVGDWRHTLPINLREGRVLLVDDDARAYVPLTISNALVGEPFIPMYQNEKLPRWQFEAVSQKHNLALTQPGKQIPSDVYVIFDLTNGSVMGEFSAADMTAQGEQLRFEGVID